MLAETGYALDYAGKWHVHQTLGPEAFGFDRHAFPRPKNDPLPGTEIVVDFAGHPFCVAGTSSVPKEEYGTWRIFDCGIEYIRDRARERVRERAGAQRPFFLRIDTPAPHFRNVVPEPYASLYDPKDIPEYPSFQDDLATRPTRHYIHRERHHEGAKRWRDWGIWQEILSRCYGQIAQTDAAIGDVLGALDELGIAEDTLVLCCADHGDSVACHGGLWDKASTFTEEVGRVPMALRWPAAVPGGRSLGRAVSNMDVTATMLEAAGMEVPVWMHSRSLLGLCRNPETQDYPDAVVCEHNGHGEDLLMRIIVDGRYKYVAALFDGDELYDLDEDPYEMRNLVDDPAYQSVKDRLRQKIIEHMETTKDRFGGKLLSAMKLGL